MGIVHAVPGAPSVIGRNVVNVYTKTHIASRSVTLIQSLYDKFSRARIVPRRLVSIIATIDKDSPTCMFVFVRTVTSTTITNKVPERRTCGFTTRTMLKDTGVILRAKGRPKRLGSVMYSPTKAAVRTIHILRRGNVHDDIVRTVVGYLSVSHGVWGHLLTFSIRGI